MPYGQTWRPCILGVPWLTKHKVNVDVINGQAVFHGQDFKVPFLQVHEIQKLHQMYEQSTTPEEQPYPKFGWASTYYKKPEKTDQFKKQVWVKDIDIDQARNVQGRYYQVWVPKAKLYKEQSDKSTGVKIQQKLMQGTRQNWSPKRPPIQKQPVKRIMWVRKEDLQAQNPQKRQWIWQVKSHTPEPQKPTSQKKVQKPKEKWVWQPKLQPKPTKTHKQVWRPTVQITTTKTIAKAIQNTMAEYRWQPKKNP